MPPLVSNPNPHIQVPNDQTLIPTPIQKLADWVPPTYGRISAHPNTLNLGFMLEVVFFPLVRVTLAWAPSDMLFATRVAMIATVISSGGGIASNAKAWAESCSLLRCLACVFIISFGMGVVGSVAGLSKQLAHALCRVLRTRKHCRSWGMSGRSTQT